MNISNLIASLNTAAEETPLDNVKEEECRELLSACERVTKKFQNPFDATVKLVFAGHSAIGLRLGIDMGLFDAAAAVAAQNEEKIPFDQLASALKEVDSQLLTRVLRMLTGMGIFKYLGKNTYSLTPHAGVYMKDSPLSGAVIHATDHTNVVSHLPDYFMRNGYRNPSDAFHGPFQSARTTTEHYFSWMAAQPLHQNAFNATMTIQRQNRGPPWFTFYPVVSALSLNDPSQTLLVDIGGGIGHDLVAFREHFPTLKGKCVLQDLPVVISSITSPLPYNITAVPHDIFTPQPIKGARAYYLRTVLHDWPDQQALEILGHVRDAMDDESILLVNENAQLEEEMSEFAAQMDMTMMAMLSSLDRTGTQFRELLEKAGFEVVKTWRPEVVVPVSGTLFEARVRR